MSGNVLHLGNEIQVKNVTDQRRMHMHPKLPGGVLTLEPGEETWMHDRVYHAIAPLCGHWLRNLSACPLPEAVKTEGDSLTCSKCGKVCGSAIGLRSHEKSCQKGQQNGTE